MAEILALSSIQQKAGESDDGDDQSYNERKVEGGTLINFVARV
jgi:hypothetical protein